MSERGLKRYGFTARYVRCDSCLRDYLPQHVHRNTYRPVGWWLCDNCIMDPPRRSGIRAHTYLLESKVWLRHRYQDDPTMLNLLGVSDA